MTPARLRVLFVLILVVAARVADATTIVVSPGPGTPVQNAIDAAAPGDKIRLRGGGYPEAITITKPLTLVGPAGTYLDANPPPATIDAGCDPGTTAITVASDGVKIRDLRVVEFTAYGINVEGRDRFQIRNVLTLPNCPPNPPVASVNIDASTHVKIDGGWFDGFTVPSVALRIANLATHANVKVRRTLGGGNDIGILLDSCAPRSVRVEGSYANYNNGDGIVLRNTDGNTIKRNIAAQNGGTGIGLDADSDDNLIVANDAHGNMLDVSDDGTGNCWAKNLFTTGTVPGCP